MKLITAKEATVLYEEYLDEAQKSERNAFHYSLMNMQRIKFIRRRSPGLIQLYLYLEMKIPAIIVHYLIFSVIPIH